MRRSLCPCYRPLVLDARRFVNVSEQSPRANMFSARCLLTEDRARSGQPMHNDACKETRTQSQCNHASAHPPTHTHSQSRQATPTHTHIRTCTHTHTHLHPMSAKRRMARQREHVPDRKALRRGATTTSGRKPRRRRDWPFHIQADPSEQTEDAFMERRLRAAEGRDAGAEGHSVHMQTRPNPCAFP